MHHSNPGDWENKSKKPAANLEARIERIFTGEGMVGTIWLRLEFLQDTILPPFTGRVTRALLFKASCLKGLARKYDAKPHLRPISLGVLRYRNGTLLYKRPDDKEQYFYAEKGDELITRISFFAKTQAFPFDLIPACSETVDLGYTRVNINTTQLDVEDIITTRKRDERSVKLTFKTPLLISTKLLAPPFPSFGQITRETTTTHRLLPTPEYIVASATRLWMSLVKGSVGKRAVYLLGRLATITIAETDYNLKPITTLYGKDNKGTLIKTRGTIGHITIQPIHPLAQRFLPPLLTLIKHIGLGKSRGIGYGETAIQYLNPDTSITKQKT